MNQRITINRRLTTLLLVTFFSIFLLGSISYANKASQQRTSHIKYVFHRPIKKEIGKGGFAYRGIRKKYQIEDYLLASMDHAPPPSPWFESEKEIYRDLLRRQTFDVLVVPFQTQLDGVDPIGRSLMSYRLALEIQGQTKVRVAPLQLVFFALGTHARCYDDADIYALAKDLGVSHIVWGFAGTHEDEKRRVKSLDITIAYQSKADFGSPEGSKSKTWGKIDLTGNQLPSVLFEYRLKEVMAFLGMSKNASDTAAAAIQGVQPSIPPTPAQFFKENGKNTIAESYLYQFMGMLIPSWAEYQRDYMFIRSLTVLADMNPDNPEYPILKARAYHHLHRRPAALEALEKNGSAEADFLREIINGNLTGLDEAYNRLTPSMNKLFALLEYSSRMYDYTDKYPKQDIERLLEQFPQWRYFFELIIEEEDVWKVPSNVVLKQLLDQYFPVEGFSIEDVVKDFGKQESPSDLDLAVSLSFQEHIRKRIRELAGGGLIYSSSSGPNALDHLIMLEGIGVANLLQRLHFLFNVQNLPKESMELCREYLKKYQGHPYFNLMYAGIIRGNVSTLQGVEKENAIKEAADNAALGLWWYGRQGWAFSKAEHVLRATYLKDSDTSKQIIPFKPLLYEIASDYPFLPYCAREGYMRPYEDLIDWSCCSLADLTSVANIYQKEAEMVNLAREKAKGRFLGHPDRYRFEMAVNRSSTQGDDPKRPYIEMIARGSQNWDIYRKLGSMYIVDGEYKKAQEVFLSYPGFKNGSSQNRVRLSNRAYFGGNYLLWRGAYEEARPLLEYSSQLNTGSGASIKSSARLALLNHDLSTAAEYMLQAAQRYDNSSAYCDYMSISHMMGDSKIAWQKFNELVGRYSYPNIWSSAFVGHRIQKTGIRELKRWITGIAESNQTTRQRSFPARFALMCLIDRGPNPEMAEFVSAVDDLTKYNLTNRHIFKGPDGHIIGPEIFGKLYYSDAMNLPFNKPRSAMQLKNISALKKRYYDEDIAKKPFSFYGSFAKAYEKLKEKAYSEAYAVLKRQSLLYSYNLDLGKPLKVYLVWAGMNSGNIKEIERFLKLDFARAGLRTYPDVPQVKYNDLEFDDELVIAAYACGMGDDDLAIERIKKAFNLRPSTGNRPFFTWYQIVELCEWFYDHSHDKRYINLALKWSKEYQVVQPMFGWAYAFEAKYSANGQDRTRALAYALHLDAQSSRISQFSEEMKRAAAQWFENNNEFRIKKDDNPLRAFFRKAILYFRRMLNI